MALSTTAEHNVSHQHLIYFSSLHAFLQWTGTEIYWSWDALEQQDHAFAVGSFLALCLFFRPPIFSATRNRFKFLYVAVTASNVSREFLCMYLCINIRGNGALKSGRLQFLTKGLRDPFPSYVACIIVSRRIGTTVELVCRYLQ